MQWRYYTRSDGSGQLPQHALLGRWRVIWVMVR